MKNSLINSICTGCMKDKGHSNECPNCGFSEQKPRSNIFLPYRTILRDQYLIGRELGKPGGFGITYLANDLNLGIPVAIKEFLPKELVGRETGNNTIVAHSDEDFTNFSYGLEKFMEEAKNLAQFRHPSIVRALNFFEANGTAYLVMDYYEGESLDEYLKRKGKIDWEKAINILLPVLDGLKEVHSKGYLHRDIKPQNIYLIKGKAPILLDFGAARLAIGERSKSLSVVLSEGYAPYEQYHRNGKQGTWTDVYACGATLYKMVTGVTPLEAPARIDEELRSPDTFVSYLPKKFSETIVKSMSMKITDRPQNARELQDLLFKIVNNDTSVISPEKQKIVNMPVEPVLSTKVNYFKPVSKGKRFSNFFIDIIFFYIFLFIFVFIYAMISDPGYAGSNSSNDEDTLLTLIGYLVLFSYYFIFESIFGKTPGKFITKTKVVNLDGTSPNAKSIFIRSLSRFIPFEPLSVLFSKNLLGWHDNLSKTMVVEKSFDPMNK